MSGVGSTRIFTSSRRQVFAPWALAWAFVTTIAAACAIESGEGGLLVGLFGVPAMVFGYLLGWWAVAVPVALTTLALTAGLECSVSESPQALMLAGSLLGVVGRRLGDALVRRR